jgi:SPP1 gp7 family putative phage head morphogenesis protein
MMLHSHNGKLCGCALRKGAPVKTGVGKYVEEKQDRLTHKIERLLNEHGAAVAEKASKAYAEKLQKAQSAQGIIEQILEALELGEVSVDIVDSISPELLRAFRSAGIVGIGQVGINTTGKIVAQLDKAALAYADSHGAELVKGLTLTTEDALRSEITRAMKDGSSAAELAKSIRESGTFGKARASTIARTELATAHIQGNVQGWRETGVVTGKEWIMGDLHDIEDVCDLNAMKGQIGLDEEFEDGIMFPPAHPNCICDVLPVLSEEEGA